MTKKLRRKVDFVFDDNGEINRPVRAGILGGAILTMDDGHVAEDRIFIHTDHFYTKRALDELIAELLFLKEEWENHPVFLEQEQAEDMEEIAEEELPAAPADFYLEEDQPNPFEGAANYDELVRRMRNNPRF